MTSNDRPNESVTNEEFDAMAERISQYFDRVRELLRDELDDSET